MKAHHHHHQQQQQQQQQTKCYLSTPTSSIDSIQSPTVADQTILQMVTCD
ncbi:unnamed protein product, partial [Rotaria magnacalcarata]